nr:MAG TPA: Lymphocyte activation family X [Caudoviricetes sp.]
MASSSIFFSYLLSTFTIFSYLLSTFTIFCISKSWPRRNTRNKKATNIYIKMKNSLRNQTFLIPLSNQYFVK